MEDAPDAATRELDAFLTDPPLRPLQAPATYAVGTLAAFWMIERVATF